MEKRLLSKQEAADYCSLTLSGFAYWVQKGRMPPPLEGTQRWDKKSIDLRLDRMSGIEKKASPEDPLDAWLESRKCE